MPGGPSKVRLAFLIAKRVRIPYLFGLTKEYIRLQHLGTAKYAKNAKRKGS
jgi:hypothetical protein